MAKKNPLKADKTICTMPGCNEPRHLDRAKCKKHNAAAVDRVIAKNAELKCSVDGCERKRIPEIGRCLKHYTELQEFRKENFVCSVDGCDEARFGNSAMCRPHRIESDKKSKLNTRDLPCNADGCFEKRYAMKPQCHKHYMELFNKSIANTRDLPCTVEGCDEARYTSASFCSKHLAESQERTEAKNYPCNVDGCKNPRAPKDSLCYKHNLERIIGYHEKNKDLPCARCGKAPRMNHASICSSCGGTERHKRLARMSDLLADFDDADWEFAKDYFGGRCCFCGKIPDGKVRNTSWTKEHWVPVTSDGPFVPNNILPACGLCNNQKWAHEATEWIQRQFPKDADAIIEKIENFFTLVRQPPYVNQNK